MASSWANASASASSAQQRAPSSDGWPARRGRLLELLGDEARGADEQELGRLVDRFVARDGKRPDEDVDAVADLAVSEADFDRVAHVAQGQFGRVDLVRCKIDQRLYCMKTMDKVVLRRSRQHTCPVRERRIHTLASLADFTLRDTPVPPLLCAFASPAALHLVTSFHAAGTLWDVLSSHRDGRLPEPQVRHWALGMVDAVQWLHGQGWAHRDVKPHNFLVDAGAVPRVVLTDFGTAAQETAPRSGRLARDDCLWPVGTPDYIAPDVLEAHEDALVRAEEEAELEEAADGQRPPIPGPSPLGYGLEVDWWSLGVVLFELVYGEAPFFAEQIGDTYFRIINFESTLSFPDTVPSSDLFRDFIQGLLSHASIRLGKRGGDLVKSHPWLEGHQEDLLRRDIFLPPPAPLQPTDMSAVVQHAAANNFAFAFSDLFVSSPSISVLSSHRSPFAPQPPPSAASSRHGTSARAKSLASWKGDGVELLSGLALGSPGSKEAGQADDDEIEWDGFTWGPTLHAFAPVTSIGLLADAQASTFTSPQPLSSVGRSSQTPLRPTPPSARNSFQTPSRPSPAVGSSSGAPSTVRRSRPMSEQRQLQELVDCVGLSARRRVLESGRKPRLLVLRKADVDGRLGSAGRENKSPNHDPFSDAAARENRRPSRPPSPQPALGWEAQLKGASANLARIETKLDGVRQRVLNWEP